MAWQLNFGQPPIRLREPLFRPPAEADSLIFQVARGCPHNTCRFCGMYKSVRYAVRPPAEVAAEIAAAGLCLPATTRIFLADGDVMALSFDRLRGLLTALGAAFPRLTRVNLYANGSSILAKTPEQLRELRDLRLHTLYLGLESGDESLLKLVAKGETAAAMVEAGSRAQAAGLRMSVMVLLGLGGQAGAARHAAATAVAINAMRPKLLSALRYVEVPGATPWPGYTLASAHDIVRELRNLLAALDLPRTVFTANHASNPVPLMGALPRDQGRLLATLDELLATGRLDRTGPGPLPQWL